MASSVTIVASELPPNLTTLEYQVYDPSWNAIVAWSSVAALQSPGSPDQFGLTSYSVQLPAPPGLISALVTFRAPGEETTATEPTAVVFTAAQAASSSGLGATYARQWAFYIARFGTSVVLPDGSSQKAKIVQGDHELSRSLRGGGDAPEKQPWVFEFSGAAYGLVGEGTVLTVGTGPNLRVFRVGSPLHPHYRNDVCVKHVVVAYPD
jgi:hypothetical protein